MLAVILSILKITGIVLLSLLGLVLLIVLVVLFVPVRYRARGDKNGPGGNIRASAVVSFLLHIITAGFGYDKGIDKYARIFGIRVWPKKESKEKDEPEGEPAGNAPEAENGPVSDAEETIEADNDYTIDWNNLDDSASYDKNEEEQRPSDDEEGKDIFDVIDSIVSAIEDKFGDINGKYKKIRKEIRFWDKMANDERNRQAVTLVKDIVIKLLKHIAPRKIKGLVHFGSDDPAVTGRILMYLSMIYPVLPRKLLIEPDFEEPVVYGNVDIKGRIILIFPLIWFLRVYFNKDCKRMWRLYKRHSENNS